MKNSTQKGFLLNTKLLLCTVFVLIGSFIYGQTSMYGDYIFKEDFGTGTGVVATDRSDITGLGQIGGLYKYEGPINYVYALNTGALTSYISSNGSKTYITGTPTWHEVPITSTSAQYALKPAASASGPVAYYYNISSWKNRTFSTQKTDYTTASLAVRDNTESSIPCSWVKLADGTWHFGFYYITYTDTSYSPAAPNDGSYALISNLDLFWTDPATDSYLQRGFKDHTGFVNDSLTPIDMTSTRTTANGRMLFVNCSATSGLTGVVYKRLVTELCKDAQFEFAAWIASVHKNTNASSFRFELWSADPGDDPGLGTLDASYEGSTVAAANGATLFKVGTTQAVDALGKWQKMTTEFKLTNQDYVWVVLRNYGSGGTGNDICLDDLSFRPYSPFNLTVDLATSSYNTACKNGLVTIVSTFNSVPSSIDISQYGFYFQGLRNGIWTTLGNGTPLQTQSTTEPLELTVSLSEYNLYSKFRVIVATTPVGFGGKCVTFTYPPSDKQALDQSPAFVISGSDICDDLSSPNTQTGTFKITNTNQANCGYWEVKVKLPDGTIKTLTPSSKSSCNNLSSIVGNAIPTATLTDSACTTGVTVSNLPAGVSYSYNSAAKTTTISGTPSVVGFYTFVINQTSCIGTASTITGTITVEPAAVTTTAGTAITPIVINWNTNTTSVGVNGLPTGVTYVNNATTKTTTISGTPTTAGTYNYTVTTTPSGTAITSSIIVN